MICTSAGSLLSYNTLKTREEVELGKLDHLPGRHGRSIAHSKQKVNSGSIYLGAVLIVAGDHVTHAER